MRLDEDLISIVIPIYNVEDYLHRCIESVIAQSYTNLEIILVNDGSTDSSLTICKRYEKCDPRIKVINKSNGGLSSARNVGLSNSNGRYISFIDSDDYIAKTYIEELYESIKDKNADIAFCNYQIVTTKELITNVEKCNNRFVDTVYSNKKDIMQLFFNNKCGLAVIAWNKLYSKNLFVDVQYPEGSIYEDEATTYKLFYKSLKVVFHNSVLYYYYQRSNSITNSHLEEKNLVVFDRLEEIVEFYTYNSEPILEKKAKIRLLKNGSIYYYRAKKEYKKNEDDLNGERIIELYKGKYEYYLRKYKFIYLKCFFDIYGMIKNQLSC